MKKKENFGVKIIGYEGEIEQCVWTGIVDDYNFEYAPYGHHKAIHISVTNKDISQGDNDVLYIYFNYPELTEENKKEIEELKKYFYFCGFPEGGVEQLYYRYGKNSWQASNVAGSHCFNCISSSCVSGLSVRFE